MFTHFNHQHLKTYTTAFGVLFSNIYIDRKDASGSQVQLIRVPLSYAQKDKIYQRLMAAPDANSMAGHVQATFPRLAFERVGIQYNTDRKLPTTRQILLRGSDPSTAQQVFVPVPYDLNFALYAFATNYNDADQILEQILPYFTPSYSLKIKTLQDQGINVDTPIFLKGVTFEDTNDEVGLNETKLRITITLQFTLQGLLFGPISNQAVIRQVQVDTAIYDGQIIQPELMVTELNQPIVLEGLNGFLLSETSNAEATSRVSRILITPDPLSAQPGDTFGYTTDIVEYDDGMTFDPFTGQDE